MPINLPDLAAAHRAFAEARAAAIKAAGADGEAAGAAKHQQALLDFLQTRVRLLTDARAEAMTQYDTEIAQDQQKIGHLQQIISDSGNAAPPVAPAAPARAPAAHQNKAVVPDKKSS